MLEVVLALAGPARRRPERVPLAALLMAATLGLRAQEPLSIDPQSVGLNIPAGPLAPAAGRRVLTPDDRGTPVVARVHVHVGRYRVVLLPDGQLVARPAADTAETDRPFEPAGVSMRRSRSFRRRWLACSSF